MCSIVVDTRAQAGTTLGMFESTVPEDVASLRLGARDMSLGKPTRARAIKYDRTARTVYST